MFLRVSVILHYKTFDSNLFESCFHELFFFFSKKLKLLNDGHCKAPCITQQWVGNSFEYLLPRSEYEGQTYFFFMSDDKKIEVKVDDY